MNIRRLMMSAWIAALLFAADQPPKSVPSDSDVPSQYTLGPGDQIMVKVLDLDEMSSDKAAPISIDSRGNITLPLVGRVKVSGLTPEQLEEQIEARLKKYLKEPDVTVSLVEMRSQPVSVLGAVQQPGVHQLQGKKTLFEVLSLAGGLKTEAGYSVNITRQLEWGRIPLATAHDDPTGKFSVASVSVKAIMEAKNPGENIVVKPNDVISVPRGELVYVVGAVHRAGGFVLGEHETISTLQALSLAEGLDRGAAPDRAKILRSIPGSDKRSEIPVALKQIMAGKSGDVPMRADDILFVPVSGPKNATMRGIEAAIQLGTGLAIYRL